MLGVYFHNGENLGRPPWLVCLRKFCISFILKYFKRPYFNVFNQFSSILLDQMLCDTGCAIWWYSVFANILDGIFVIWIKNGRYSVFQSPGGDGNIQFQIENTTVTVVIQKFDYGTTVIFEKMNGNTVIQNLVRPPPIKLIGSIFVMT